MVEIGEGEVIFGSPKLDVTLLADVEQLAAVDVRAAPGWGKAPPHVHVRHGEALYVLEGELALQLEDRVHRVGRETWAFVPPGVVHAVEVVGDAPARFLVLHAPGSGYGDYVRGDVAASISGRRRMPCRPIPGSPSSGARGGHSDSFYVLEGEVEFHVGDQVVHATPGTYVLAPPNVVHYFRNVSNEPVKMLNLHTPGGFVQYRRELQELRSQGIEPDAAFFEHHDVFDV